jgi:hypothetical protein
LGTAEVVDDADGAEVVAAAPAVVVAVLDDFFDDELHAAATISVPTATAVSFLVVRTVVVPLCCGRVVR